MIEHKSIATEVKVSADAGSFEGYAATFLTIDSYDDRIQPGAFTKTLAERGNKVKVLWNHNMSAPPIGVPTDMFEDATGLYVKARFSSTSLAQDVRVLMQEGAIDSMSIGYSSIKSVYEEIGDYDYIRNLLELRLWEFSPVNMPANPEALITDSKSIDRMLASLDNFIDVGIKSGRPLSADKLKRVKSAYEHLGALLEEKATEPREHSDTPAAAETPAVEPVTDHSVALALKSFSLTRAEPTPVARALAEIRLSLKTLQED